MKTYILCLFLMVAITMWTFVGAIPVPDFAAERTRRDTGVDDALATTSCARGDYFSIQCNTCYCNQQGTGYLCTKNDCIGREFATPYSTTVVPDYNNASNVISSSGIQSVNDDDISYNINHVSWQSDSTATEGTGGTAKTSAATGSK